MGYRGAAAREHKRCAGNGRGCRGASEARQGWRQRTWRRQRWGRMVEGGGGNVRGRKKERRSPTWSGWNKTQPGHDQPMANRIWRPQHNAGRFSSGSTPHKPVSGVTRQLIFFLLAPELIEMRRRRHRQMLGPCASSTKQRGCDLGEISDGLSVQEPREAGTAACNLGWV